jgi:hypothetical protein
LIQYSYFRLSLFSCIERSLKQQFFSSYALYKKETCKAGFFFVIGAIAKAAIFARGS